MCGSASVCNCQSQIVEVSSELELSSPGYFCDFNWGEGGGGGQDTRENVHLVNRLTLQFHQSIWAHIAFWAHAKSTENGHTAQHTMT